MPKSRCIRPASHGYGAAVITGFPLNGVSGSSWLACIARTCTGTGSEKLAYGPRVLILARVFAQTQSIPGDARKQPRGSQLRHWRNRRQGLLRPPTGLPRIHAWLPGR